MTDTAPVSQELQMARDNLLYAVVSGSQAYGTARPDSDQDVRGVFVPTLDYFYGLNEIEQVEVPGEDTTYYTLKKFVKLAMNLNPNIIELLFVPEDCILYMHDTFKPIYEARQEFLSQRAVHTYTGYAISQLKRLEAHYRWLSNPPTHPNREDYGALDKDGMPVFFNRNAENDYKAALREYQNYEDWKRNRNEARAALEAKYGYDTKFASHVYRLMVQGQEILTEGTLHVRLRDMDLAVCQAIMAGKWKYEDLLEFATGIDKELHRIADSGVAVVPWGCDQKRIGELLMATHSKFFYPDDDWC
jgi:predicted nucleotidyltransferase